jgi:hypothetical protein
VSKSDIALKLLSFGPNGVNVFQVSFFLSIVSIILLLFIISIFILLLFQFLLWLLVGNEKWCNKIVFKNLSLSSYEGDPLYESPY